MRLSLSRIKRLWTQRWRITLPTYLTMGRIILTPFTVLAMIMHYWGIAFWLFLLAAATDLFDGFLARMLNQKTFLGACLDPIADKILIVSCFATLTFVHSPLFRIPLWFVLFVLVKEVFLLAGAVLLFQMRQCLYVCPTFWGKSAMAVQTLFIIWLFACYFFHWLPIKTYTFMLSLVIILVFFSFIHYVVVGYKQLMGTYETYN